MKYLDTNIVLRYLTRDDEEKAAACYELLQAARAGEEELFTLEVVVAEVVYVLSSRGQYNLPDEEIRALLTPVLNLRGLHLPHKGRVLEALDLYVGHAELDFEDALIVAHMRREETETIVSYDRDFDEIPGVQRIEP